MGKSTCPFQYQGAPLGMKWMGQKCIPQKRRMVFIPYSNVIIPQRPGRVLTHATPSDIKRLQNVCQFVMTQPQLQSKHLEVPQAAQSCPKPGSLYPIDPHGPTLLHSRQRRRPLRDGLRLKCCLQIDVANCPTVCLMLLYDSTQYFLRLVTEHEAPVAM